MFDSDYYRDAQMEDAYQDGVWEELNEHLEREALRLGADWPRLPGIGGERE